MVLRMYTESRIISRSAWLRAPWRAAPVQQLAALATLARHLIVASRSVARFLRFYRRSLGKRQLRNPRAKTSSPSLLSRLLICSPPRVNREKSFSCRLSTTPPSPPLSAKLFQTTFIFELTRFLLRDQGGYCRRALGNSRRRNFLCLMDISHFGKERNSLFSLSFFQPTPLIKFNQIKCARDASARIFNYPSNE